LSPLLTDSETIERLLDGLVPKKKSCCLGWQQLIETRLFDGFQHQSEKLLAPNFRPDINKSIPNFRARRSFWHSGERNLVWENVYDCFARSPQKNGIAHIAVISSRKTDGSDTIAHGTIRCGLSQFPDIQYLYAFVRDPFFDQVCDTCAVALR
jgi:hypothetical protein